MKLWKNYQGGNNSMKLDPDSLNQELQMAFVLKEDDARNMIRGHLENFNYPLVATSWGKDSTILSHLVITVARENGIELPIFAIGHTNNIFKEEPDYWKQIQKFLDIPDDKFMIFKPEKESNGQDKTVWSIAKRVQHLPMFRRSTKDNYIPYKFRKEPECCSELKKEPMNIFMKKLPKNLRIDLTFSGIRADESQMRRFNVLMHCRTYTTNYDRPYPIRNCTPLAFWLDKDVDEYFKKYDIPLNPAYVIHNQPRMGCASCPAHMGWELRLAGDPTNDGKGMLMLNLTILKASQPNRFWNSVAILTNAGYYDLAEKAVRKPIDVSWIPTTDIFDEPLTSDGVLAKEIWLNNSKITNFV